MEGNQQKMREACQKMRDLLMLRGDGKAWCVLTWDEFNESQKMLRAALSAPPRNCDVGTPEEQGARFVAWRYSDPLRAELGLDALAWAQMPYEAEEGGAK